MKRNDQATLTKSSGVALISMLFIMALMVILVVAITLLSRSELRSADTYQTQVSSSSLSNVATNLVIAQIRSATSQAGEAWASQPGAIRKYSARGDFLAGFKLYSDDDMIIDRESGFFDDIPDSDWQRKSQHYVDINEPIITDSRPTFPILDPRADGTVEGFSFTDEVAGTIRADDATARLPMPVRWIYILEDGTTGHLDPKTNRFVGYRPGGEKIEPDKDNPIVGRIAYWTDDESGKININTASEPTFWDTPKSVSLEDLWYARAQPTQSEYQRFPGHPATTALSPVLFGNQVIRKTLAQLDGGEMKKANRVSGDMKKNRDIKEAIYDLAPRVNVGGSESGTRVNKRNDPGITQDGDHLYASLDEFIFKAPRLQKNADDSREQSPVVNRELLERSRFFLTAHSRAPELNLFGLPRVSIWPTDSEGKQFSHLTAYDKLIRFCSTSPAGDQYFFTRQNSDSPHDDWVKIKRNREVYNYLKQLTSRNIPGVGGNFSGKFGADHEQILTEIFDYIRTTNLCDDSHPRLYYEGKDWNKQTQFTNARVMNIQNGKEIENQYGTHSGHGQVSPIRIGDTMGFGRFPTLSEVCVIFICCADPGESPNPQRTGGERIEDIITYRGKDDKKIHYTNFPPLRPRPTAELVEKLAEGYTPFDPVEDDKGILREATSIHHPSYDPHNWNHALRPWNGWNTPGSAPTNCKSDEMVVQMAVVPEAFIPSQGWSAINSRFRIIIEGLDGLQLNGKPLGLPAKREENKAGDLSGGYHGRAWGGGAGFRKMTSFNVASQPLKIKRTGKTMAFTQTKPISVKIFCEHSNSPNQLVQVIHLKFPDADFPLPEIQKVGTYRREGTRDTTARLWWTFNQKAGQSELRETIPNGIDDDGNGIIDEEDEITRQWKVWGQVLENGQKKSRGSGAGIFKDSELVGAYLNGRMNTRTDNPGSPWTKQNNHSPDTVTRNPGWKQGVHSGGFWREGDVVRSLVPFHGEGKSLYGGDTRLVAMTPDVDEKTFRPQYNYFDLAAPIDHTLYLPAGAHYYWRFGNADLDKTPDGIYPAFNYPVQTQLTDASYHFSKFPDYPRGVANSQTEKMESHAVYTGDFDNGVALTPDGAYLNKPDGGNRSDRWGVSRSFADQPTPYFDSNWTQAVQGPGYFSPNRQISSPVMFGSLPTGVKRNIAWQTLLFRPQPWGNPEDFDQPHPGSEEPKDHYLLDLFWMPVVEPYAISEPFSTAGKINLNYQILPFTYIKRATGLHAVLKAEEMLIVSDKNAAHYKNWDHELADYYEPPLPKDVHLRQIIDIDETLKQFEDRFLNGEIFKSATEVCDIHLVPLRDQSGQTRIELPDPEKDKRIQPEIDGIMKEFWMDHSPTGDNSRERPYSNLYPRLTTKSNTFRIHTRAQVLKKVRGSDPKTFDPEMDTVAGEWRGSTLIERYIDPNNQEIPDYVTSASAIGKKTLDQFYRFRIIFRKRFDG